VLIIALNEWLPDSYKLLPPAGHPGPGEGRRRSLREIVADRRAVRAARRAGPPPGGTLEECLRTRPHGSLPAPDPARERRLGEVLRGYTTQRQEPDETVAIGCENQRGPREPELPAQGWRDWWLRDEER
jgi:hypothetical protein